MLIILVNIIHQFSPFFKSNQSINCIYSLRIQSINLPIVCISHLFQKFCLFSKNPIHKFVHFISLPLPKLCIFSKNPIHQFYPFSSPIPFPCFPTISSKIYRCKFPIEIIHVMNRIPLYMQILKYCFNRREISDVFP